MDDFPTFLAGVVAGVIAGFIMIFGVILDSEEDACRQEHNVYKCQRVYTPVEVAE